MPGPKKKHPKYKAVLVKCSDAEHKAVMRYAKVIGRGVGPMLRSVQFNVLVRRAEWFNALHFPENGQKEAAVTGEWAWLGKCQTMTATAGRGI